MAFKVSGKVALISGGASGIGFTIAKVLLNRGLKGVTLADVNKDLGEKAVEEITRQFGANKVIYVKTDVVYKQSYEEAFRKTVETFQQLDILVNNAGILNDFLWEREIDVNLKAYIHGTLLGLETYMPKYISSSGGVILNISSVAGLHAFGGIPIYTATKFAVLGLSLAFAKKAEFDRSNIKILVLCPGVTESNLLEDFADHTLGESYYNFIMEEPKLMSPQKIDTLAAGTVSIIEKASNGTIWVVENEKGPYQFIMPNRESFTPK